MELSIVSDLNFQLRPLVLVLIRFHLPLTIIKSILILLTVLTSRSSRHSPIALWVVFLSDVLCSESRLSLGGSTLSLAADCPLLRVRVIMRLDALGIECVVR